MPEKKTYSLLCPVHHLWSFKVQAESHEDALRVFKAKEEEDLRDCDPQETHGLFEDRTNILDPIEVRLEPYDEDELEVEVEVDTGYIKFLQTQGRYPQRQELDEQTGKPIPYRYEVEVARPTTLTVCATSEEEASSFVLIECDSDADADDMPPAVVARADRKERVAEEEYLAAKQRAETLLEQDGEDEEDA